MRAEAHRVGVGGSEGTVKPAQVLTRICLETARSDLECRTDGGGRDMEEEGAKLEKPRSLESHFMFVAARDVLR